MRNRCPDSCVIEKLIPKQRKCVVCVCVIILGPIVRNKTDKCENGLTTRPFMYFLNFMYFRSPTWGGGFRNTSSVFRISGLEVFLFRSREIDPIEFNRVRF